MTDERFDRMIQDFRDDHRKTMHALDRFEERINGSLDRIDRSIGRTQSNIPAPLFIVFWMGVVPFVGILAGIWFFGLR